MANESARAARPNLLQVYPHCPYITINLHVTSKKHRCGKENILEHDLHAGDSHRCNPERHPQCIAIPQPFATLTRAIKRAKPQSALHSFSTHVAHDVVVAHICRRRTERARGEHRIINAEHMQNKWKRHCFLLSASSLPKFPDALFPPNQAKRSGIGLLISPVRSCALPDCPSMPKLPFSYVSPPPYSTPPGQRILVSSGSTSPSTPPPPPPPAAAAAV